MSFTSRVAWEPLRSLASTSLTGAYQAVGTPLAFPSYIFKMINTGTTDVTISVNGTSDVDVLPAGGFFLYDEGKVGQSASAPLLPQGTQIFVKGTAGTAGSIYVVTQYIVVY